MRRGRRIREEEDNMEGGKKGKGKWTEGDKKKWILKRRRIKEEKEGRKERLKNAEEKGNE